MLKQDIHIVGEKKHFFTPSVNFSFADGYCEIMGYSYHEEPYEFYQPLCEWIKHFFTKKDSLIFSFRLSYFNSGTSKCILNLLFLLKSYQQDNKNVIVNWYYEAYDDDMYEEAIDFINDTGLDMNIIGE